MRKEGVEFLESLYEILETPLYSKILGWCSNGESFEIRQTGLFTTVLLSRFYDNENYESFVDQLIAFKFKRISDTNIFNHPLFNMANRSLCSMIVEAGVVSDLDYGYMKKQGSAFLEKLFDILEDSENQEHICWCSDGKSILVKRVEEFSQVLVATLF
jgi:hypothetical protein